MKKLTFVLSMVCFSIPAWAQFAGLSYEHRMAQHDLTPTATAKIQNIEVTPTVQPRT